MRYFQKSGLIIDDDEMITNLFTYVMKKAGLNAYTATNGVQACDWLKDNLPDIILCDIMMPEQDGFEIYKLMRNYEHVKEVPILAVTAMIQPGDRERILAYGFNAYIPKPINLEKLLNLIYVFTEDRLCGVG